MLSIIKEMIKSDFSLNEISETVRMFIGKKIDDEIDFNDFYFSDKKYDIDFHQIKLFLIEIKVLEDLVIVYCPRCGNRKLLKGEDKIIAKPSDCDFCKEGALVPIVRGLDFLIIREIKKYYKEEKWS